MDTVRHCGTRRFSVKQVNTPPCKPCTGYSNWRPKRPSEIGASDEGKVPYTPEPRKVNGKPACTECGMFTSHTPRCPLRPAPVPSDSMDFIFAAGPVPVPSVTPITDPADVKAPSYYARWAIEPITFIMRNGLPFWCGSAVKYTVRAGYKVYAGKTADESAIVDLEKAIRVLQMRVNQLKGDTVL